MARGGWKPRVESNAGMARELAFETTTEAERGESEPAFLVDVDGF